MSGQRQPIELVQANKKKHLTKAEIEKRSEQEAKAPSDEIGPPSYLSQSEKIKFNKISKQLKEINIMSNLDCDCLARHIQSETKYQTYDKMVNAYIRQVTEAQLKTGESKIDISTLSGLENLRDKALKQCRASASDLGLTISSRCKLVVPKAEKEATDPYEELFG
jgi:P27 family predicted phage terminase small subunit